MPRGEASTLTTQRARDLAKRRHSLDTYIASIVDRAPELTPEQHDRLAAIVRPAAARARAKENADG